MKTTYKPVVVRVENRNKLAVNTYCVKVNGVAIGYVEKWESYLWEIDSPFVSKFASMCKTRKGAVVRIVADYQSTREDI